MLLSEKIGDEASIGVDLSGRHAGRRSVARSYPQSTSGTGVPISSDNGSITAFAQIS